MELPEANLRRSSSYPKPTSSREKKYEDFEGVRFYSWTASSFCETCPKLIVFTRVEPEVKVKQTQLNHNHCYTSGPAFVFLCLDRQGSSTAVTAGARQFS